MTPDGECVRIARPRCLSADDADEQAGHRRWIDAGAVARAHDPPRQVLAEVRVHVAGLHGRELAGGYFCEQLRRQGHGARDAEEREGRTGRERDGEDAVRADKGGVSRPGGRIFWGCRVAEEDEDAVRAVETEALGDDVGDVVVLLACAAAPDLTLTGEGCRPLWWCVRNAPGFCRRRRWCTAV